MASTGRSRPAAGCFTFVIAGGVQSPSRTAGFGVYRRGQELAGQALARMRGEGIAAEAFDDRSIFSSGGGFQVPSRAAASGA